MRSLIDTIRGSFSINTSAVRRDSWRHRQSYHRRFAALRRIETRRRLQLLPTEAERLALPVRHVRRRTHHRVDAGPPPSGRCHRRRRHLSLSANRWRHHPRPQHPENYIKPIDSPNPL